MADDDRCLVNTSGRRTVGATELQRARNTVGTAVIRSSAAFRPRPRYTTVSVPACLRTATPIPSTAALRNCEPRRAASVPEKSTLPRHDITCRRFTKDGAPQRMARSAGTMRGGPTIWKTDQPSAATDLRCITRSIPTASSPIGSSARASTRSGRRSAPWSSRTSALSPTRPTPSCCRRCWCWRCSTELRSTCRRMIHCRSNSSTSARRAQGHQRFPVGADQRHSRSARRPQLRRGR